MGATQSKKRRKERKRRRRQHGGPSSAHFDVPRSVSLDALRSYGVTSSSFAAASDCSHCGGWSWGSHGGRAERRTFSGLLESTGVCHGFHRCLRGQYDDLQGVESQPRTYDSDDDAGRWSYHVSCPTCSYDMSRDNMASQASLYTQTHACPGPEHSTMSLNRHAGLRVSSKFPQTRSSEFSEMLDILRKHEKTQTSSQKSGLQNSVSFGPDLRRLPDSSSGSDGNATSVITLPDQSNRVAISSTVSNTVEAPALVPSDTKSPTPPPTQVMEPGGLSPVIANTEQSTPTSAIVTNTPTRFKPTTALNTIVINKGSKAKKPISVVEDEETRLARWEKQKLMAEQLQLLRKHLMAREAALKAKQGIDGVCESLPLTLQGPLDAVESYLSSHSQFNSTSFVKSAEFNSTQSKSSSKQSLPNPSPDVSQTSGHVQRTISAWPQTNSQSSSRRGAPKACTEEKFSSQTTSSFTFSSAQTNSCSTAIQNLEFEPSQCTEPLVSVTSSQSQTQTSPNRSKFKRQGQNFRNLDNHPVLSRLQNEQNSRLERMERKMRYIRASAEQAAERKKFEQIFPARREVLVEDEKQRMKEAEETLAILKEENKKKKLMKKSLQEEHLPKSLAPPNSGPSTDSESNAMDSRNSDDSGEVIPVHVLPDQSSSNSSSASSSSGSLLRWRRGSNKKEVKQDNTNHQPQDGRKKPHWLNSTFSKIDMDLGHPLSWLVLPFLLFPLILRLLLSLAINTKPQVSRSPSPSPGGSTTIHEQTVSREVTSEDNSLIPAHPSSMSRTETKTLSKRCGSKVKLQRGDSSETPRLK